LEEYARTGRAFIAVRDAELGDATAKDRFIGHASEVFANIDMQTASWSLLTLLVLRAGFDVAAGDWDEAGRALGAIRALEGRGSALWWTLLGRRERALEEVRIALGSGADSALTAGAALGVEDVVALITRPV
jgi:hypothetical protein